MNFTLRYLYMVILKHQHKIKQIKNQIHKSTGRVYWIIKNDKLETVKPKTNESDRYF